jgi:hypothetical protein
LGWALLKEFDMDNSFTRLGTHNMVLPPEGPKAYSFTLDFTAQNVQVLDFLQEIQSGFISFVQGMLIDNTLNANAIIVSTQQINFPLRIPAGKQAYMPLMVTDSAVLTFTTTQNLGLVVPLVITNCPVSPIVF